MKLAASVLGGMGVIVALGGCGAPSSQATGRAPGGSNDRTGMRDNANVASRLVGQWRLVDFHPDVSLEPALQMLLSQQVRTMVIRFDGSHLYADSPTIHVNRAYQVTYAAGPIFKITSPDYGGGTLVSSGELSDDGNQIVFHGESEPWMGTGTLQRIP